MAKKNSGAGCGCLVAMIAFGLVAKLYELHPTAAIACGIATALLLVAASIVTAMGSRCDICRAPIKKTRYHIRVDGRNKTICPTCNRRVQARISKQAVDAFLSDGGD